MEEVTPAGAEEVKAMLDGVGIAHTVSVKAGRVRVVLARPCATSAEAAPIFAAAERLRGRGLDVRVQRRGMGRAVVGFSVGIAAGS